MVRQYPHYLFATLSEESRQDENGNWTLGGQRVVFLSICREETDGRGQEVQTADGRYRKFSSVIQIPKSAKIPREVGEDPHGSPSNSHGKSAVLDIREGTSVFVADSADGSGIRIEGVVLKFDRGQLHSRLWV